jgi:pyruvate kinase
LKGTNIKPIVKLETKEASEQENLNKILTVADTFLIDRGDLLSEVGLIRFPNIFNMLLKATKDSKKSIFIATQLFGSMYQHNVPFLSEIMEFHRLLKENITGVQLSEETAIGLHPFAVLEVIKNLVEESL